MRFYGCALLALCCLVGFSASTLPVRGQNGTQPSNFALELNAVIRQVPVGQLEKLVQAYLLNDAQFQGLIRVVNSMPAYRFIRQLGNQPEVRQLMQWVTQQLLLSGGSPKIFDHLELEIKIFNKYPYWSQSVHGIDGFTQDFVQIYPVQLIRSLLEPSATQTSPLLSDLWRRLVALRPVYDRIIASPPGQALIGELQRVGLEVDGVDALIRYQFGWSNATWSSLSYDYGDYLYY